MRHLERGTLQTIRTPECGGDGLGNRLRIGGRARERRWPEAFAVEPIRPPGLICQKRHDEGGRPRSNHRVRSASASVVNRDVDVGKQGGVGN